MVGTDYAEPDVMSMRYTSTPGDFPDLDLFNRPIKSKWTKDLSTDKNFYDIDIAWDRNSNITRIEDNVHAGFDVAYSIDNLNRLTDAQEGTWGGSSITSETREQEWTLSHTGNWDREKLDLNGDGDWSDSNEENDTRTHNVVNELTAQDRDTSGGNDRTLTYDEAGNLTYDGYLYTCKWDAFYRLREVRLQSNSALVAEYKYNGLGFRISRHSDTDNDSDVDANDKWYHTAFDSRWRTVATFRESDSDPKETFVNHQAGLDGHGGSSYIDLVICRNKDANTAWTTASDGTLEERVYYCQNYHADVSALVSSSGTMIEWDKYFAYGTPFGLIGGDTNSDGDCDAADVTQIQTWIDAPAYDLRGDIDLDGDVDATDKSTVIASFQGITLGRAQLTRVRNRKGSEGYEYLPEAGDQYLARQRTLSVATGRWNTRDALEFADGLNLVQFVLSSPLTNHDPDGLKANTTCGLEGSCATFGALAPLGSHSGSCSDELTDDPESKPESKPAKPAYKCQGKCSDIKLMNCKAAFGTCETSGFCLGIDACQIAAATAASYLTQGVFVPQKKCPKAPADSKKTCDCNFDNTTSGPWVVTIPLFVPLSYSAGPCTVTISGSITFTCDSIKMTGRCKEFPIAHQTQ